MANRKKPDNVKVKSIAATATTSIEEKVKAISEARQWSFAKTAGYLIERGLEVEQQSYQLPKAA